ncbi:MAG: signal peptide peptidase SppA [Polyangiaceae bacterium]
MILVRILASFFRVLFLPFAALRRRNAAGTSGWLALELRGSVTELPAPRRYRWFRRREGVALPAVVRALAEAAKDPRVRGLLLTVKNPSLGMATATSLRRALSSFRASGKKVTVHLPLGGGSKETYLASVGDLVVTGPRTSIAPVGFASHVRYVRGALDRVHVTPEIYARGRYKSAGEQLAREGMSEAQREQLEALHDTNFEVFVDAIASGRSVTPERAREWIDSAPHDAESAKTKGLVDAVAYEDELDVVVGADVVKQVPRALAAYLGRRAPRRLSPLRPRATIGVVAVHGAIVHARETGFGRGAEDDAVVGALRLARKNPRIHGVVLSVDSPGGGALASDRIHHEVVRLAREKPVVCAMANVAASGGYYVAAPCHVIVAEPTTITGSIGVVSARFALDALLESIGIRTEVVHRGARSEMFSTTRAFRDEERAVVERDLDVFYRGFVRIVAEGRSMTEDAVHQVAQGRVWSGRDAKRVGLVDELGGMDTAIGIVCAKIGVRPEDVPVEVLRGDKRSTPLPVPDPPKGAAWVSALATLRPEIGTDVAALAGVAEFLRAWAERSPLVEGLPLLLGGPSILALDLDSAGF